MYFLTQDLCETAGLPAYEVSNHAKLGQESRHNLIYWRGGDYVGIGPGAHGRLTRNGIRHATTTPLQPDAWLRAVREAGTGEASREPLDRVNHAGEYLMMSLRTREGTDLTRLRHILGKDVNINKIKGLVELGLVENRREQLVATRAGRAVLNAVITELLPD